VFDHVELGLKDVSDLKNDLDANQKAVRLKLHETIQKVSADYAERQTFNTAIAANMELLNTLSKFNDESAQGRAVRHEVLNNIVLMLAPIVPHITHQLWQALGNDTTLINQSWPTVDEQALKQDSIEMMVQVNGKLRAKILVASDADKVACETAALNDENVQKFIIDKSIKKIIVVPKRLINIVV